MSERNYTLTEAATIRQMDECARYGHSWDVIQVWGSNVPVRIYCACGWEGAVTMRDKPTRPEGTE